MEAATTTGGGSGGSNGGSMNSGSGGVTSGGAGGAPSSSTSTGGTSTSTTTGVSGAGGAVCCLAEATCNEGDQQIDGPESCPEGASCYENSICCSSVWCVQDEAQCDAYPACMDDEQQVEECAQDQKCVVRTLCGSSILCAPAPQTCNPELEYNRSYVAQGSCAAVDFDCSGQTTPFYNDCGCGCEQDASCPEFVNCMPSVDGGAAPFPDLCSDREVCPLTTRAE